MTFTLVIPRRPPTKNDIKPDMGLFRMGPRMVPAAWVRVKNLEAKWAKWIPPAAGAQRATGPRRVGFVRVLGPGERRFDTFNLVTGINAIVCDELVRKGYLLNDDPGVAVMEMPTQIKAFVGRPGPALLISFEDLAGAEKESR